MRIGAFEVAAEQLRACTTEAAVNTVLQRTLCAKAKFLRYLLYGDAQVARLQVRTWFAKSSQSGLIVRGCIARGLVVVCCRK